jgi:hypothetical protein
VTTANPTERFDIESKPAFAKGVINRVALVQVTDEANDECLLAHVYDAMGRSEYNPGAGFPAALARLLEDPRMLVAGVGVRDDLKFLERDYGVNATGFVCASVVAGFYGRPKGLKSLAESFGLHVVGLYKFNPADPQLETTWFQALRLSSEKPGFQSCFLKFSTCAATPRQNPGRCR